MTKKMIRKMQIVLIIFVIIIAGIGVKSLAADYTLTLTLDADKAEIKAGETVTLSIKVSNIQAGEGIAIYNTIVEYDESVFDLKVQSDSAGAWTTTLIENSLTLTKANYEATSKDQEIGKILLTAKSGATLGKQTIKLTNNEFSDATSFSVSDVSKTVEIVSGNVAGNNTTGGNNTIVGNTNVPTGNTNNGGTTNNVSNSGNVNTGKSNNVLPKAGVVQDCLIGAIIATVVIALGFYIKYKRAY